MVLEKKKLSDTAELGVVADSFKKVNRKQMNKLLRMYPQPPYEINVTHGKLFSVWGWYFILDLLSLHFGFWAL